MAKKKITTYQQSIPISFKGTILSASSSEVWCHVSPATGQNNGTLILTFEENTGSTPRDTSIYVESTHADFVKKIEIKVTQLESGSEPKSISVSPSELSFEYNGAALTITVTGDTSWTVRSNLSWCTVSPDSGSENGSFSVSCSENDGDERTASITLVGEQSDTIVIKVTQKKKDSEPVVEQFWYSDNYIVDIAVDDYMVHNYNFGQHTHGTADGWERQSPDKREYLCNVAVIPNFSNAYVYGTKYVQFDKYEEVTISNITFSRYEFIEITASQYTSPTDDTYKLQGPFYDLSSSAAAFAQKVQDIGDEAGREPNFNLNFGRVRPLGGVEQNQSERVPSDPGNIWNSIYNATMVAIISGDPSKRNNVDLNSDAPTSYPSGHAAQTWTTAMILLQAYHSNISKGLQYVKAAYAVGVARTVGRFHWNSDTMYGRVSATMIMPIVNASGLVASDYDSFCINLGVNAPSEPLPTNDDYTDEFADMLSNFTSIVTIREDVKKYLWSLYKAADEELRLNTNKFFSQSTYPEKYPTEGYTITINDVAKNVKLRGSNTTYNVSGVTREGIMQSWLMAMALSEIFISKDDNSYNQGTAPTESQQNVQTKLFAKAYEIGGGRALSFYNEYKIDYDPTILRLAAAMVYAKERGRYSYDKIRGLTGATPSGNLSDITTSGKIGCSANRHTRNYTVGWGVNSYYIFPDGPGPHKKGSYTIDGAGTYKYYRNCFDPYNKKTVGSDTLKQQAQDKSLFCIGEAPTPSDNKITYTVKMVNHTKQAIDPAQNDGLLLYLLEQHLSIVVDLSNWTQTISTGGGETTFVANCHTNSSSSDDYIAKLIEKGYHYKSSHYTSGEIDKAIRFYWPGHNSDTVFMAPLKGRLVGDKTTTMVLKIYDTIEEAEANA